ncbi:hypothetical protein [Sphingobacterium psychroaquaticum]|uniref:SMODS-associating 2TM beta-strand rich effector domain-containing protein n=1 Tax=Sphingobacterium psychroaquaticum TaxID=561061 RepID=A0A1X7IDZ2_9SPHI|nr:hypothetical protein [Sphingobacterium psychroaquaticum]SMG12892.1 hypothetical protein SAMN05660862_0727 [Sphingobacterium psychroaquaticum]
MDYNILLPLIPFFIGILLKTLLDFNLAISLVKFFSWFPVRWLFRTKPIVISGKWVQIWDNDNSAKYTDLAGRRSDLEIKQLGKYLYGEFRVNNNEQYYIFGEIIGSNIVGKWGEKNNELGYYGAFEMRINDAQNIKGIWLGHSNSQPHTINSNNWIWNKNNYR